MQQKRLAYSDSGGTHVVQSLLDGTAEHSASEELRSSELIFRQIAANIRSVFFLRDADSDRMLYVSPAYEKIWGRSSQALYTDRHAWTEAVYPEDRAAIERTISASLSSSIVEYSFRIVRPDGSIRWIESKNFPVRNDSGKIVRIAGLAEDITQRVRASASLVQSQQRLALATESAHLGIWELNVLSNTLLWDDRMYALYGLGKRDLNGANTALRNGLHPEDRARVEAQLAGALEGGQDFHTEFRVVWPNGEIRDLEAHANVQRAGNGAATRMIGVSWDITSRKRADTRIKRLNRVYAVLSGINSLIVRVRDRDELFREACQVAVEHGQFKMAWIGLVDHTTMTIVPVASAGMRPEFLVLLENPLSLQRATPLQESGKTAQAVRSKKTIVTNEILGDTTMVFTQERIHRGIISMAILPLVVLGEVVGVLELYSDEADFFDAEEVRLLEEMTGDIAFAIDHIEKQKRIDYLAYYDVLTGLANRNLFLERLAQRMLDSQTTGSGFALYLMDLERFKNVNDSLGHAAGDTLLKQVATWLEKTVANVSLLARVGADQFAIIIPALTEEGEISRLLEQAAEAFLDYRFQLNDSVLRISAKVGVAVFPRNGATAAVLFENAGAALKKAKSRGARYLLYTEKMREAAAGKLALENKLRQALVNREFVLHYQPKINIASGKVSGVEALLRWNDPKAGLVSPGQFVPVLEETGLIVEVGRWALQKALEDYLRWVDAGWAAVRIAVNVSPLQLRQRDFISEIEKAIGRDRRAAAGLELEITENLIMEDVKQSISSLHSIRELGVKIAIDDFGTGFSSLSYLAKLPVDTLKIDRSFVMDMTGGPQGLSLVSTIISLAHGMKLDVVAEGVETEEQARLLRLLSCDEIQGFLYSKPLPVELFEARYLGKMQRLEAPEIVA